MLVFLRKYSRTILLITVIGFMAGIFIGLGSYFTGRGGGFRGDVIAVVNGVKIPYYRFQQSFQRRIDVLRDKNVDLTDETYKREKQEVLRSLIQEEIFVQEARKFGITVTDTELALHINNYQAFHKDGRFDKEMYFRTLAYQLRTTPQEFEESERRRIAIAKLNMLINTTVKVTEPELVTEYRLRNSTKITEFEKEKETFRNTLTQERAANVFNEWYRQLGRRIKVKDYLAELEGGQTNTGG